MNDGISLIELILNASFAVQLVMFILFLLSIISWVIIVQRWLVLSAARKGVFGFEQRFWSGMDLSQLYKEGTQMQQENIQVVGMENIFRGLGSTERAILFPIHPRTRKKIDELNLTIPNKVKICNPLSYLSMSAVLSRCIKVITDSGGLQKEAYWAKKPCITLRDETEWVETLEEGANCLVGAEADNISDALNSKNEIIFSDNLYGDGKSAPSSVEKIINFFS